jgi:hypothetical protein
MILIFLILSLHLLDVLPARFRHGTAFRCSGANATHRRRRSLLWQIEERELIAAAHVKEDVRGSWIVPILYNSRKAHPNQFDIKANRRFQVRAEQRRRADIGRRLALSARLKK